MTNTKNGDRRTSAPVYDPAIPAPVLRLPAISHAEALAILADRSVIDLMEREAARQQADFAQRASVLYRPRASRKGIDR
jgi:hypothetical protein